MKGSVFFTFALGTLPLMGAVKSADCSPGHPATCYPDDCCRTYCLGPENYGANAPVRPYTCNGDFVLTVAGLYWNAHQDGMEYAILTDSTGPQQQDRSTLINAQYKSPHFDWNWGFKAGVGYNTTCDGWDVNLLWTHYNGKASSHDEAEADDNTTLLVLWSGFEQLDPGDVLFARDINTKWALDLDLVDLELGRMYWNSRRLNLRPFIGLRYASIKQAFHIEHKGGSFDNAAPDDSVVLNEVDLDNDFTGAGARVGLDSLWNLGCGWAIYGDFAFSLISGKFAIDHNEMNRRVQTPFSKSKVMEIEDFFRNNVMIVDLGIGVQYQTLLCDCDYALAVSLGWEQHFFPSQNQLWRIVLLEGTQANEINNIYHQRRGDLSTNGWTLRVTFDF
jgi:hypothetical protein